MNVSLMEGPKKQQNDSAHTDRWKCIDMIHESMITSVYIILFSVINLITPFFYMILISQLYHVGFITYCTCTCITYCS